MPREQGGADELRERLGGSQGRECDGMLARKDPLACASGTDLSQQIKDLMIIAQSLELGPVALFPLMIFTPSRALFLLCMVKSSRL